LRQEVKKCKEKWKIILRNIDSIKNIIDTYRNKFGPDSEAKLPEAVRAAFTAFEKSVYFASTSSSIVTDKTQISGERAG
jgi:hypothetical protein